MKVALACLVVVAVVLLVETGGKSTPIPAITSEPLVVLSTPPASSWPKAVKLPKVQAQSMHADDDQGLEDMMEARYFSRLPKP